MELDHQGAQAWRADVVIERLRFAFILTVAAVEYAALESARSFCTTRDFFRYRVRWIVTDKLRAMFSSRR